nr:hypothetical protein Iba_scaffold2820CG0160 [Ipomoea batatas]
MTEEPLRVYASRSRAKVIGRAQRLHRPAQHIVIGSGFAAAVLVRPDVDDGNEPSRPEVAGQGSREDPGPRVEPRA